MNLTNKDQAIRSGKKFVTKPSASHKLWGLMKILHQLNTLLYPCLLITVTVLFPLNYAYAQSFSFETCQKKLLGCLSLEELSQKLRADFVESVQGSDSEKTSQNLPYELKNTLTLIDSLNKKKDCSLLLKQAELKSNGLLKNRNEVASRVLGSFVQFHSLWLTPKDYDSPPVCQNNFQNDVFDPQTAAYHFTRALFQRDRNVSMSVTAYGDLRSIRKGENPTPSKKTGISSEQYQEILGLEEPLDLTGEEQLLGFLYKKPLSFIRVKTVDWSKTNKSWEQSRQKGKFPLYKHLGGGFLGSPGFILHYAPPKAYQSDLYKSDGKTTLPRKLAEGILKNVLCLNPLDFKAPAQLKQDTPKLWNHPITQEKRCLDCHHSLDNMAAGLRHVTFLKSQGECGENSPQILIPANFESSYSQALWQETPDNPEEEFHFSYPIGYLKEERFVGFNQLGKIIAQSSDFYSCQVEKYHQFLFDQEIEQSLKSQLASQYQEHQDGIKLLEQLLKNPPVPRKDPIKEGSTL